MSIFDMFKAQPAPAPAPAANPNAPANPGNMPDQQTPVAQTTPVTEPAANPAPAKKDDSPMAEFSQLWDTVPTDPNNPTTPVAPKPLDQAQLQAAMAKADFSKAVTPEMMTAITAGGEEAGTAFSQAMNAVVQQAMVQSTLINEKLTAQAVQNAVAATEAKIPGLVREQSAAAHIQDANPVFSNPAIKPVIDATRTKLMEKSPNATPAQINAQLNDFVTAMSETLNPAAAPAATAEQVDWNKFLQ